MYLGQAQQDKFILNILKHKRNGNFLEIGSNDPITINNTYILEKNYDWKGILVEYESKYLPKYKEHRPKSIPIIEDATKVDYKFVLDSNQFPFSMDYLQIDLEADNGSTIRTLEKLDNEVFDTYKFATITFEHDIYHTNFDNTRIKSRNIFSKRGYVRVFDDINNEEIYPYEDWYVHPDLVDMDYVNRLIEGNKNNYVSNAITGKTINWKNIHYNV